MIQNVLKEKNTDPEVFKPNNFSISLQKLSSSTVKISIKKFMV